MGSDRLIYFRTDGNAQIASGHLVRCFSIALACRQLGMHVCFLVSDLESVSLLKGIFAQTADFSILRLRTASYDHPDQELSELIPLLAAKPDVCLFVDSYFVTESYLSALRPYTKLAYLDDLQRFDYPVDLLINYDAIPAADLDSYRAAYQNAGQLLLGASYAPLRSQFQTDPCSIKEQITDILVTTGGSDPYHFCLKLIRHLTGLSDFETLFCRVHLHVVVGSLSTDQKVLSEWAEQYPFVQIHENLTHMASLMARCDLAVSASGTTLYELCALGLPAVSFTMADNQLTSAAAFEKANTIPCAGDIRRDETGVFQKITDFIRTASFDKRKSAHETMRRLVDGNGALYIADALMKL